MRSSKGVKAFIIFMAISFLIIIFSLFVVRYIKDENTQYELYADYNRASIAMVLNFVKDFNSQYEEIRYQQRYVPDRTPISKETLIFDFASYKFVPILDYLYEPVENEELFSKFSKIIEFTGVYNSINFENSEDIFVRQKNNKYYIEKDNKYIYTVKKKVITKDEFNKLYFEYIKYQDIESYFASKLITIPKINSQYNTVTLKEAIATNYKLLYTENKNDIINIIINDLDGFGKHLFSFVELPKDYISTSTYTEVNSDKNKTKLNLEIKGEKISINYEFSKVQRLYNEPTKYSLWLYSLNLDNIWHQLESEGYPMLYQ